MINRLIREGYYACRDDVPADGNPYPVDTLWRLAWALGWNLADLAKSSRSLGWIIERRVRRLR